MYAGKVLSKTGNRLRLVNSTSNQWRHRQYVNQINRSNDPIFDAAKANAELFDAKFNFSHQAYRPLRLTKPIRYHPPASTKSVPGKQSPGITDNNHDFISINGAYIPNDIVFPPYAMTGQVPSSPHHVILQDAHGLQCLSKAGKLARNALDATIQHLQQTFLSSSLNTSSSSTITTNDINTFLHNYLILHKAYPSPLNYANFPKSICTSINEVVCHGIPDGRGLELGDLASLDVSCFLNGYHGDNCSSIIVGDDYSYDDDYSDYDYKHLQRQDHDHSHDLNENHRDKHTTTTRSSHTQQQRNSSLLDTLTDEQRILQIISGRRLIQATRESLHRAIQSCHPGSCLSDIGATISTVAEAYGYDSVQKYRGHGIGTFFHGPPYVKHFRNDDEMRLEPGMVFTIEPMLVEGDGDCVEWQSDGWTVVTRDGGRAAQFEHMVCITEDGVEILTLP